MGNVPPPPPPPPPAAGEITKRRKRTPTTVGEIAKRRKRNSEIKSWRSSLTNYIDSLPDELLLRILLQLPAEDFYDTARFVSNKWRKLIRDFVREHLDRSTPGLVVQSASLPPIFLTARLGRIEKLDFEYDFGEKWSSCNGLIVGFDAKKNALYVSNPEINKRVSLPQSFHRMYGYGIAYAPASTEYKVVHSFLVANKTPHVQGCAVLTLGDDSSWRGLSIGHLSHASKHILNCTPFTTEGFMHWTYGDYPRVLTLNVEREIITEQSIPDGCVGRSKYYFPTERSLTLLVERSELSWDVWELEPETGEWTKLPTIDLELQRDEFENSEKLPAPIGWLNDKEVLVFQFFRTRRLLFLYNIRKRELEFLEVDYVCTLSHFYRSSLVWFG
ncbi:hypothetical protein ABFX02_01G059600 [Erythranthe guttata]